MRFAGPGRSALHSEVTTPSSSSAAQEAVEVADVDALLADERRQQLEQLVPVQRPLAQEQQRGGLGEPLEPRLHLPLPVDGAAGAASGGGGGGVLSSRGQYM